jgi:putative salt-induced outer membrane protein
MNTKICLVLAALGLTTAAAFAQATDAGAPTTPPVKWDSSAALGLTLTRGNSKTLNVVGDLQTARKWDQNELSLGASGNYGDNDGTKSSEELRGYVQYNRLFGDRWFGYLRLDGLHDGIADIHYRYSISPGVGYYFIKNQTTSLRAEIGPGYAFERIGNRDRDYATLRLAERLDHKINERVKLWQSVEILPEVTDFQNYVINAEIGVEAGLTKKLSLRVFIQDTYDNQPAPDRDKNDVKLVTALAYKF